ncbi:hypothetical protein [Kitasatospora sp. A2-31]|uniref:hypothetical protein n=1 Tax=Kitasatospora sp. A2-31 TaxID=2916414 RepID=UPI001EEE5AA4|nr:hypothetical protein [Kitasatospora sp. A2-31]MCG6499831.1 hypothetical protein [Kitasatospora sp. A2-31]MCG6499876.1 hypothetical protein [Kitasatospora sp. A2-31]
MTAAVPFSRAARPEAEPGDAERPPRELMALPGLYRDVRRWRLVEVRLGGRWRPGLLTVWRRPPGSSVWVVHVRWAEDTDSAEPSWGWFLYSERTIRPLPEPGGRAPAAAPFLGAWRDAAPVPAELAGPPGADGDVHRWQLVWIRTGGRWCSGTVTARRRLGERWIAHVRWGEDRQVAWVVMDGATVQPVPVGDPPAGPDRSGTPADTAAGRASEAR